MKKFGFWAFALAAVFMVSCGNPDTPGNKDEEDVNVVNSVTLDKATLDLNVGAEAYLKAVTDPAGQKVTWKSSDTQVVTVNSAGLVAAVAEGTATITASAGEKTAECKVTVSADAIYDMLEIADWGLFGDFTPVPGAELEEIELSNGMLVNVRLNTITFVRAWDADAAFVNGTGFTGNGMVYTFPNVGVWVIEGGDYDGYYIGSRALVIDSEKTLDHYYGWCGNFDAESYGTFLQQQCDYGYTQGETEVDFDSMLEKNDGAFMCYNNAEAGQLLYNYGLYWGKINRAVLYEREDESKAFALDVDWFNITAENRYIGFLLDEDILAEDPDHMVLVKPYAENLSMIHRVVDENGFFDAIDNPEPEEAPKYELGDMSRYHKEIPAINHKLDTKTLHMAK